jgi:hypothetical protein
MPPLTLAILASLLQVQGADATITSDNKGIDDLLANIRGQLQNQVDPNAPRIIPAAVNEYTRGYGKGGTYTRNYSRHFQKWVPIQRQ